MLRSPCGLSPLSLVLVRASGHLPSLGSGPHCHPPFFHCSSRRAAAAAQVSGGSLHTQVEPQTETLNPLTFSHLPVPPTVQQPQGRESLANEEPRTLQCDKREGWGGMDHGLLHSHG